MNPTVKALSVGFIYPLGRLLSIGRNLLLFVKIFHAQRFQLSPSLKHIFNAEVNAAGVFPRP
jgi:hypothetical protein